MLITQIQKETELESIIESAIDSFSTVCIAIADFKLRLKVLYHLTNAGVNILIINTESVTNNYINIFRKGVIYIITDKPYFIEELSAKENESKLLYKLTVALVINLPIDITGMFINRHSSSIIFIESHGTISDVRVLEFTVKCLFDYDMFIDSIGLNYKKAGKKALFCIQDDTLLSINTALPLCFNNPTIVKTPLYHVHALKNTADFYFLSRNILTESIKESLKEIKKSFKFIWYKWTKNIFPKVYYWFLKNQLKRENIILNSAKEIFVLKNILDPEVKQVLTKCKFNVTELYYMLEATWPLMCKNLVNGKQEVLSIDVSFEKIEGTSYSNILYKSIHTNDVWNEHTNNICRKAALINTDLQIPLNSADITSIIDDLPYIKKSLLITFKGEIVLLIYPNITHSIYKKGVFSFKEVAESLKRMLNKNILLNLDTPNIEVINKVIISPRDFITNNDSIYHYFYSEYLNRK
jgi:hypothetical protein